MIRTHKPPSFTTKHAEIKNSVRPSQVPQLPSYQQLHKSYSLPPTILQLKIIALSVTAKTFYSIVFLSRFFNLALSKQESRGLWRQPVNKISKL